MRRGASSFEIRRAYEAARRDYAGDSFPIEVRNELDAEITEINDQYHKLRAYPDVLGALKSLKAQGLILKIVANPTKQMIEAHSKFAGTLEYIDEIISSGEEAQAFKPSPKVYQLGVERAGCAKEE